jgi:cobalt-zinc-cadmium efflux system outer membrane protein
MRPRGAVVLGALVAFAPTPARAQEAPLTFPSALDLAIASNLDLAAARRGRAVREAEVKTAGQHPNPDLVFESTKDTPHQMLSLDVPLEPWKRSRRIDLAREELKLADVDDAAAMQALRRSVRLAFYGLLAAEEGATLAQSMVEVATRVHEVAQARFEEGAAPRLDVMGAELGLARAKADLELVRSARLAAQAELNGLLNRPGTPSCAPPSTRSRSRTAAWGCSRASASPRPCSRSVRSSTLPGSSTSATARA